MVERIDEDKAGQIANRVRDRFPGYFPCFKQAFTQEYPLGPDFIPQAGRTYFLVLHNGRCEALCAVTFQLNGDSSQAAISHARLFPRQEEDGSAGGWWYLREVIYNEILRAGVTVVKARLESKGGRKSFQDLEKLYPAAVKVEPNGLSARVNVEKFCKVQER